MNLVPYTLTALSRQDIPDTPNDRNVVIGAVITCQTPAGATVTMFDDAQGANGSASKQTGANGQVTVFVEPGEYVFSVNGRANKVVIADFGLRDTLAAPDSSVLVGGVEAGDLRRKYQEFVSVGDFGAKSNLAFDDADAVQDAVNFASANGILDVRLGKLHKISKSIFVPLGVRILGQGRGCFIYPTPDGNYTAGFMFLFNTLDGVNWVTQFPNSDCGGLENVVFRNGDTAAMPIINPLRGAVGFGSYIFKNLRGRNMTQMVRRGASGIYADNFVATDIYCEPVIGAEYQVDLRGLGDGAEVSRLHFPKNNLNPGNGTPLGLRVAGSFGVRIGECIGGDVLINQSKVSIENGHYEYVVLTVDNANVDIKSTYISPKDRIPLVLTNSGGNNCQVSLSDVEFAYVSGVLDWDGFDVSLSNDVTLSVKNTYRRYTKIGSVDKNQLHGIRLQNSGGAPIAAWNNNASRLSLDGRVFRGNVVDASFKILTNSNSFSGISSIATDSTESWLESSGTYFYNIQYVIDSARRIGRNGTEGEKSISLTNGGNGTRLTVGFNNKPQLATLRIYRGASAGSYDKFVDIPAYACTLFYDSGERLNGFPWQSRTAGAVDTLNGLGEFDYEISGVNCKLTATTIPTVGAWQVNDEILRSNPTAGGKRAWVCTAAGTPGTWKPWGVIDA